MRWRLSLFVTLILGAVVSVPVSAQAIDPPAVYSHVALVRAEIELIRAEMGRPAASGTLFETRDAQPREVYFQALALFKRSDRLCFDICQVSEAAPRIPNESIAPRHVFEVVHAALGRLRHVKEKLGIPEQSAEPAPDAKLTPTDVFQSIMAANRQLNLLLDEPFSPSDAFEEVTLAVHHATRLRARFSGKQIPDTPSLERRKQPGEVFRELAQCFDTVRDIAKTSDVKTAELRYAEDDLESVGPSDVYDLAALIVAELAHLHLCLTDLAPPNDRYPPGRKYPAHVFQRTRLLQAILDDLQQQVEKNPSWLREGSGH